MQRTEKYFESDAFRKTAAGVILAAEADAKTGGGRIALDGTVFYPCLLYTSPSPRDGLLSRMPSSA